MNRIIGLTPSKITATDETIEMKFSNGSHARWHHLQDCCEYISIESVTGDWNDLIGHPLLVAECRESAKGDNDDPRTKDGESYTWTFYTFRSIGGSVDVRWFWQSNGAYSEEVDFGFTEPSA